MSEFSQVLRTCREQSHLSQRALSQAAGVNQAIISRLESGDRTPSGAEQVLAIARALNLDRPTTDTLLGSAGYWPQVYLRLGPQDQTLRAVAEILADERMPEARRQRFRRLVQTLAEEWSAP